MKPLDGVRTLRDPPLMRRVFYAVVVAVVALGSVLGVALPAGATFAGRNGLIVLDTGDRPNVDGGSSQIYTVRPDGSGLTQVTRVGAGHNASNPHWSPDGSRIVYVSDQLGSADVWVMRWDGAGNHRLLSDPGYDHSSPSWSPDGRRLIMSRCSQFLRTCSLATVGADGTGLRTVTRSNWNFFDPVWSPDGRWLAYGSDKGGYDYRLWVAHADGTGAHTIGPARLELGRPAWSPNSQKLLVTGNPVNGQLFSIRRDGTDLHALTPPGASIFGTWSPDDRRIVLLSFTGTAPAIAVATANAHEVTPIVSLPGVTLSDWAVAR